MEQFLTKLAQIFGNFLGYFEKCHFKVKTIVSKFSATLGEIWLLSILTSGHTVYRLQSAHGYRYGAYRLVVVPMNTSIGWNNNDNDQCDQIKIAECL